MSLILAGDKTNDTKLGLVLPPTSLRVTRNNYISEFHGPRVNSAMYDSMESSGKSCVSHARVPLWWGGVGGDEDASTGKVDGSALGFHDEWISVEKTEEEGPLEPAVELINDDIRLSIVATPPSHP